MIEEDKKYVWHPFTQMKTAPDPLAISSAKDALLFDENGKSYIDANASWWVNVHGHAHPHIAKTLEQQFKELDHVIFAGATHPQAVKVAKRISDLHKDGQDRKVFFSDNGSTAVEVALKMTYQYWYNKDQPRKRLIALQDGYHGDTFGAMSVGERGDFFQPFKHLFFNVDFIPKPTLNNFDEVKKIFQALLDTGDVAGLIFEPLIQGAAGMLMYEKEALKALLDMAKDAGIVTIADEVMTGNGRTGSMFAMDHMGEYSDISCLSKGVSGGVLPMGLTVANESIFDAFWKDDKSKALLHGHSFTANPLACAAVNASLDLFEQKQTWDNIRFIERRHEKFLSQWEHNPKINTRQMGTIAVVEIDEGKSNYFSKIKDQAYDYFIKRGLLIRPLGNIIFLNPPYCITEDQLDACYDGINGFLEENLD